MSDVVPPGQNPELTALMQKLRNAEAALAKAHEEYRKVGDELAEWALKNGGVLAYGGARRIHRRKSARKTRGRR